jgi:mRNA-degrading endonuclease RelE of RelBE toxin-antitoxin system
MANKIIVCDSFRRQAKKLSKRYKSLPADIQKIVDSLKLEARTGTPLSGNAYKIRVAISSKKKGKSGGARIISYAYIEKETVYLMAIYDKSEIDNLSDLELSLLIKEVEQELSDA